MNYFDSIKPLDIDLKEYCFLMEDTNKYSDKFKVFIPKLMPLMNINDTVKETREPFRDILINDTDNKPTVGKLLISQNYINVRRKRNSWFNLHPNTFNKGTRLICEYTERNIRHGRITDEDYNVDRVSKHTDVEIRNPMFDILDKINVGDTVKVAYKIYSRTDSYIPGLDYEGNSLYPHNFEHMYDKGITADLVTGEVSHVPHLVQPIRTGYVYSTITTDDVTVSSVTDFGITSGARHFLASQIIKVYKNAGEYYSYYEDSDGGE